MTKTGTKGGPETSQNKTLEEKRIATRLLRRLRREERTQALMLEFRHHQKLMGRVHMCGLIQVAHQNLNVLKRAVDLPGYYLDGQDRKQKVEQAASDLNEVLTFLDRDLSEAAREQGLA